MSVAFLFYIFIAIGVFYMVHMGIYIVGANVSDILSYRSKRREAKGKIKKKNTRPLVSVIIPAYNEELSIRACLDSVRSSSYKKIEVFVHNDRSTDSTAAILRSYKNEYPDFNLRAIDRRSNNGKAGGLNYCIRKYAKGSLIMTLDADCMLNKDAIKNAVKYFRNEKVVGVAANVQIRDKNTILGLLQKFEHMIGYRSKNFFTLANCEFIVGGVASTYRKSILDKVSYYDTDTQTEDIGLSMKIVAEGNKGDRIVYAPDVVASTGGVLTLPALIRQRYRWKLGMLQNLIKYRKLIGNNDPAYSRMLTMYRVPVAFLSEILLMLEPFILMYVIYLSVVNQTLSLFIGAYMTITLYVLWTIWPDEHTSNKDKVKLSLYSPFMYFIFYIMNLVQIVALVKVLRHPSKVMGTGTTGSSWVSPTRNVEQFRVEAS